MPLYYFVWLVDVDWIEVDLLVVWWDFWFGSLRPKSVEKLPNFPPAGLEPITHATVALTAQNLNVRQRKLGTIIIQTICILQHESAVTDSLPKGESVHGHSNLFPNDLARHWPAVVPLHLCTNSACPPVRIAPPPALPHASVSPRTQGGVPIRTTGEKA